MSWKDVKQELSKKNKEELIQIINNIYKSSKQAEKYLGTLFSSIDEDTLYKEYSEKIMLTFFPKRGFGCNLGKARTLFNEYNKLPVSDESKGRLALCFAEGGIKFTKSFGDIDMPFYDSVEGMYRK